MLRSRRTGAGFGRFSPSHRHEVGFLGARADPLRAAESAFPGGASPDSPTRGHEAARGRPCRLVAVYRRQRPASGRHDGTGGASRARCRRGDEVAAEARQVPALPRCLDPRRRRQGRSGGRRRKPHRTTSSPVSRSRSSRIFSARTSRAAAAPLGPSRAELARYFPAPSASATVPCSRQIPSTPARRSGRGRRTRTPGTPAAPTPSCHSRVNENDSSHVSRSGSISGMPSSAPRMPGQRRCWWRSLRSSGTVVSPSRTAASATATASGAGARAGSRPRSAPASSRAGRNAA